MTASRGICCHFPSLNPTSFSSSPLDLQRRGSPAVLLSQSLLLCSQTRALQASALCTPETQAQHPPVPKTLTLQTWRVTCCGLPCSCASWLQPPVSVFHIMISSSGCPVNACLIEWMAADYCPLYYEYFAPSGYVSVNLTFKRQLVLSCTEIISLSRHKRIFYVLGIFFFLSGERGSAPNCYCEVF